MAQMRKHCEYGAKVLHFAEEKLGIQSFLSLAMQLTHYHHEKWNVTGYPHGHAGDSIPLSGRIMALADNYDALRAERVYKSAIPHEECRSIIEGLSGTHFDPEIVTAFPDLFLTISEKLAD